jgi:hypothetical protein
LPMSATTQWQAVPEVALLFPALPAHREIETWRTRAVT